MLDLSPFEGFQWDEGNAAKSWKKHGVSQEECEQAFFNEPIFLFWDERHSRSEARYYLLGKTDRGRRLFVVFTPRGRLVRVISARSMTRRERGVYDGR